MFILFFSCETSTVNTKDIDSCISYTFLFFFSVFLIINCCLPLVTWQYKLIVQFPESLYDPKPKAHSENKGMMHKNNYIIMQHAFPEQVKTTFKYSTNSASSGSVFILVLSSLHNFLTRDPKYHIWTKTTKGEEWSVLYFPARPTSPYEERKIWVWSQYNRKKWLGNTFNPSPC